MRSRLYWHFDGLWVDDTGRPLVAQRVPEPSPVEAAELRLLNLTYLAVNQVLYGGPGPLAERGVSHG